MKPAKAAVTVKRPAYLPLFPPSAVGNARQNDVSESFSPMTALAELVAALSSLASTDSDSHNDRSEDPEELASQLDELVDNYSADVELIRESVKRLELALLAGGVLHLDLKAWRSVDGGGDL